MYKPKAVLSYWQHALQQQAVTALLPKQAIDFGHAISFVECTNGKLLNAELITELNNHASAMVVVPCYAKREDSYFIPYVLLIDLDAEGNFVNTVINSFPIVPQIALEPAIGSDICLGAAENFDNYLVLQPPAWLEDPTQLTWQNKFTYAQQMLRRVTQDTWRDALQQAGYVMQDAALIFPVAAICSIADMDVSLLKSSNKVEIVDAARNSGKSAYAQQLIEQAWMEAAVKQAPAPEIVWLQKLNFTNYNYASLLDINYDSATMDLDQESTHRQLTVGFNIYIKGKQLLRNWQELAENLRDKYIDVGGVAARIEQLNALLKDAHVRNRHLQVLYSIWTRQQELITGWLKIFDFIPAFQRRRLRRLYSFFKQNFPGEEVAGFNQTQLHAIISEQMLRIQKRERFIADTLHQIESEIAQESLVRDKFQQWLNTQGLEDLQQLWHKLVTLTRGYWRFVDISRQTNQIELLIVEHAEYMSPMRAAQLLAISKRAVIMGNYNPLCNPRFPVAIDFELTKYFKLADCDADFEDLQFDGVLGSVGNLWNLAANGREANKILTARLRPAIKYQAINVLGNSQEYLGSKINKAEAAEIIAWLQANSVQNNNIAIYTTFSGQINYLRTSLQGTKFAHIPVFAIQEPCFDTYENIIFSPVYTSRDPGPYLFDRGVEMLDGMLASASQKVIVIGDLQIFKPELHSAAGKFAKLLFNKQEEEVDCV